jgi:hypothetical protein
METKRFLLIGGKSTIMDIVLFKTLLVHEHFLIQTSDYRTEI